MIDFHSHILFGVDDGSRDVNESLEMLRMLYSQDVDTVVATPHFQPDKQSVAEFVDRRQASYNELISLMDEKMPEIILGAEVEYYDGISNLESLEKLCIGNTRLLLLEMPMCQWSEYALKELNILSNTKGFVIILAHIERYIKFQPASLWQKLSQYGVLMQVNASFFNSRLTRRKALSMLLKGGINVIGSDCHNISNRPPLIGSAFEFIRNKAGDDILKDLAEYHKKLIYDK